MGLSRSLKTIETLFAGHEVQVQEWDDQVRRVSRQQEELSGLQVSVSVSVSRNLEMLEVPTNNPQV